MVHHFVHDQEVHATGHLEGTGFGRVHVLQQGIHQNKVLSSQISLPDMRLAPRHATGPRVNTLCVGVKGEVVGGVA